MSHELKPNSAEIEQSELDIEAQFTQSWDSGDKIGALEAVMGRYINASEISSNPDLATVITLPSASEAYGAALVVKTLEEMAAEK